MYSLIIHFGINIRIKLDHCYRFATNVSLNLSLLPPKQHKIPLIVSRQISIANVSPNLTDAQDVRKINVDVYNYRYPMRHLYVRDSYITCIFFK